MKQYLEEALSDTLFAPLWSSGQDTRFRSYASAALAFGNVTTLDSIARSALYREIATATRSDVLDRLSGLIGWKNRLGLLSKTAYSLFDEQDWLALFHVSEAPSNRRALSHLKEITPDLLHQILLVPTEIRTPAILAVLNRLKVSAAHWRQLAITMTDTPPSLLPSLVTKAQSVTSIGSFWDFYFEWIDKPWQPFDLPDRFLFSPMLKPLRTRKELDSESLRMENCLASQAENVRGGRHVYFRWRGALPATVQFIHTGGWHLGRILGAGNQPLPYAEIEKIRLWAELLLNAVRDEPDCYADIPNPTIQLLCDRSLKTFRLEEHEILAASLRAIQGKTQGLGPGTNAYCVFGYEDGFVQFMADVSRHEFLCEIQSHHYHAALNCLLTDNAVTLITESGFIWPKGLQNFSRWFKVDADADIDILAAFSLGILGEIFGYEPSHKLEITTHVP